MHDYPTFRHRLDASLRTLDVQQVRQFLIAEGQWSADLPADPQLAMWLMIAGSPTLKDLHARAGEWLNNNGHAAEAKALLSAGKKQNAQSRAAKPSPPPANHKPARKTPPAQNNKQRT